MNGPDWTRDYQPRAWPPGWQPRHLRGEYSVQMDSPRRGPEATPRTIPDDITCMRVPPGASMRDAINGRDHRWNNQHGERLAASMASAAEQSRRSKAAAKLVREPRPPKPPRDNPHRAAREAVISWLRAHGQPATRGEIADGLGWRKEDTRAPINRLIKTGVIQARHYSLAGRPGHQAQYLTAGAPWPAWPEGATPLAHPPRTSTRRPTE